MKRMKAKLPSWELGEKFIKEVADMLQARVEVRDEKHVIEMDDFSIHVVPDDRGFSFITIKYSDDNIGARIKELLDKQS